MDKMAIARRKCARGAVLTLLFGNPRAAVMQRTLEYALMQDDPQAMSNAIWATRFSASYRTRRGRRSSA